MGHSTSGHQSDGCQVKREVVDPGLLPQASSLLCLRLGEQVGLCSMGLQSPCECCPPVGPRTAFRRQWTSPHPGLCALMAAAVCLGCSVQDLTPPCGQPEETAGQLGPGCMAASAMTAGQGLGAWPCGSRQLKPASS